MNEIEQFVKIQMFNSVFSVLYFLYVIFKEKDRGKAFFGGFFLLISSGFGIIFLTLSRIYYKLVSQKHTKNIDISEVSFVKDKAKVYNLQSIQEAKEIVPLEEAIQVSDTMTVRKNLLNLLKDDYIEYIQSIYEAISNEDSEISHYASTAIIDVISKFKKSFEIEIQKGNISTSFVINTVKFLKLDILSKHDIMYYANRLNEVMQNSELDYEIIFNMADLYLHLDQYEQSKYWIEKYETMEKDLYVYKIRLKYFFQIQDQKNFMNELEELKHSQIALDHQMLEMIRIYT